jgi:hypothetical protein
MKNFFAVLSIVAVLGSFSMVYAARNAYSCIKYCSQYDDAGQFMACLDGCMAPIE